MISFLKKLGLIALFSLLFVVVAIVVTFIWIIIPMIFISELDMVLLYFLLTLAPVFGIGVYLECKEEGLWN